MNESARLKIDLMFEGLRYSHALERSAEHAFPNFYPYRFQQGEDQAGRREITIPYLLRLEDGTLVRIKGSRGSSWQVAGSQQSGYRLAHDPEDEQGLTVDFEPLPDWMKEQTSDGFPMARTGVSLHGDMVVINVAPGCEFFLEKNEQGTSMRCTFCSYGAPDERTRHLGQVAGQTSLPPLTYQRMRETLKAVLDENTVRHIYLVGGSMTDWREEGLRFLELAREVQALLNNRIPVSCGSGAIPVEYLRELHGQDLVQNVCFNLEVWSEPLFAKVCPGKHQFVGYARWIEALEAAVKLWGLERVYSAMVAGVELESEHGLSVDQATNLAIQGAKDLCSRGIIPIYSLHWPLAGRDHPLQPSLRSYFEKLNLEYQQIRRQHGLRIWEGFMCHRCAYMQLECDLDREPGA